jgi:hypothetical protein
MTKLTDRQKKMLADLHEGRSRYYDFIDLRTFNALFAKGLVTTYTPPGNLVGHATTCHLTPEGRATLP